MGERTSRCGREYASEAFEKDRTAFLIPEFDTQAESKKYLTEIWQDIFEYELDGWCTEEAWWPKDRTFKMFKEWFDVEVHSVVIDLDNSSIVKKR